MIEPDDELSMLEVALGYALRGWFVFPVHSVLNSRCSCGNASCASPGKHPRTKNGLSDATRNEAQIRSWWTAWPGANLAVATEPSGIVVVDYDAKSGGMESREALIAKYGRVDTMCVLTGGGGMHDIFAAGASVVASRTTALGPNYPGIDTRGRGGYIVAAPSMHISGRRYEWEASSPETPLPLPAWLLKLTGIAQKTPINGVDEGTLPIVGGGRNNTLTRYAGRLRRQGTGAEAIEATLLALNAKQCRPPLGEAEVTAIARSIARYSAGPSIGSLAETMQALASDITDAGTANYLRDVIGNDVLFEHERSLWRVWTDVVWRPDRDGELRRRVEDAIRQIVAFAAGSPVDQMDLLTKHAKKSLSRARLEGSIKLLEHKCPVLRENLDTDDMLLGVHNGVIDLRTGKFDEANRAHRMTLQAGVRFDARAAAPTWQRFLLRIFDGDTELVDFIHRAIGYSLTGLTNEQVWFLFHGQGKNGKSTLLDVLSALLGDYAKHASSGLVTQRKGEAATNDVAAIVGARIVTITETDEQRRLADGLVKTLTGGDTVTARFLFHEFFSFKPKCKLFLATNHRPVISDGSLGMWRRIRLVPFDVVIPENERDPYLKDRLLKELPGILNWALAGLAAYQRDGLTTPARVLAATEDYRVEQNVVASFVSDCCEQGDTYRETVAALYARFKSFAEQDIKVTQTAFGRKLGDLGFTESRTSKARLRLGIRLRHNDGFGQNDGL